MKRPDWKTSRLRNADGCSRAECGERASSSSFTSVRVADVGGKEFEEADLRPVAGARDEGGEWQLARPGTLNAHARRKDQFGSHGAFRHSAGFGRGAGAHF